jgi:hypothetical protein
MPVQVWPVTSVPKKLLKLFVVIPSTFVHKRLHLYTCHTCHTDEASTEKCVDVFQSGSQGSSGLCQREKRSLCRIQAARVPN